jgi:hypothetical protein
MNYTASHRSCSSRIAGQQALNVLFTSDETAPKDRREADAVGHDNGADK